MTQITRPSFSADFAVWFNTASMDDLYSAFSDSYKECHGIRPRWVNWATREEAADDFEALSQDWIREDQRRAEDLRRSTEATEKAIATAIECGAGDRETALRWMTSECDFQSADDIEHYAYNQGVLFSPYGKQLIAELREIWKV